MHVLACELDSLITSVVLKRLIDVSVKELNATTRGMLNEHASHQELDAYTYTHIRMNCSSLDALYALNVVR